jgi:energy-coupling factor transporter ATP-binding protein EcfA2
MSTVQEITLSNVGPVKRLSLEIPEPGGLCVLRGRNGSGKSKTLEAVETALTGRGKVEVRDGELRGEVEAFGVKLTVGRSTRRSGELVVESLDGKLSVSDLIDPGLKSPEAADARRIKALVALANVLPSAELFYPLVGGREEFEKLIGTAALASEDLVTMAERIKRDLEAKARTEESQAEHAEGRARGAREAAAGVDLRAADDATVLQRELEAAIRDESSLVAQAEAAQKAALAAKLARDQMEDAESRYDGPSLQEARDMESVAQQNEAQAAARVREAEEALRAAREWHETTKRTYAHAVQHRKNAEQHEALVQQWREQIAASIPVAPTPEQLTQAGLRVQQARQAVEVGALVRKARQHLAEADKHAEAARLHRQRAEELRTAAHGIDDVLSDVIARSGSPLRVEHGRLVLTTRRGNTYYHDLSAGERARIAIDIGIEAVGEHGVLTLSQEIFEGLDPLNREALAKHAVERGVVILTAEASDDEEVTAEVYQGK